MITHWYRRIWSGLITALIAGGALLAGMVLVVPTTSVSASDYGFGSAEFLQWLQVPESDDRTDDRIIGVVKGAVNWILGILALIMLILVIRWWFQMLFANGDSWKYTAWFTILKNAAIGLAIVGLAWMIISIIIFVIELTTSNAWPAGTGG